MKEQGYNIEINNLTEKGFLLKSKKNNKEIDIELKNVENDYFECSVVFNSQIEDFSKKYISIDYDELVKVSHILGVEKITDSTLKEVCEDKRNYYDSSNEDYKPEENIIMSKIYREGFFENPVIIYELSAGYSEMVSIYWNC